MSSTRTSRFLASTAVALAGLSALGAGAASATASYVTMSGNPSCAELDASWTEHKIDKDPGTGDYFADSIKVKTTKATDGSLGWTSELDIDAVIVKGGDNANVYAYPDTDGADDKADAGLRPPTNPNGGDDGDIKYYGFSHVSFCSGPPATVTVSETPSTPGVTETPAPAASPTPEPEVSATAAPAPVAPAAVVPEVLETAVLGVSIEAPAPAPAPEVAAAPQVAGVELAATGMSSATLAALAIALVLFGGVALALGGRAASED